MKISKTARPITVCHCFHIFWHEPYLQYQKGNMAHLQQLINKLDMLKPRVIPCLSVTAMLVQTYNVHIVYLLCFCCLSIY